MSAGFTVYYSVASRGGGSWKRWCHGKGESKTILPLFIFVLAACKSLIGSRSTADKHSYHFGTNSLYFLFLGTYWQLTQKKLTRINTLCAHAYLCIVTLGIRADMLLETVHFGLSFKCHRFWRDWINEFSYSRWNPLLFTVQFVHLFSFIFSSAVVFLVPSSQSFCLHFKVTVQTTALKTTNTMLLKILAPHQVLNYSITSPRWFGCSSGSMWGSWVRTCTVLYSASEFNLTFF